MPQFFPHHELILIFTTCGFEDQDPLQYVQLYDIPNDTDMSDPCQQTKNPPQFFLYDPLKQSHQIQQRESEYAAAAAAEV